MIFHTVLLDPKPETTAEEIKAALEHVRALQQKIPGITAVSAGANLNSGNNQGGKAEFLFQRKEVRSPRLDVI